MKYYGAIDIGGTNIKAGVVDENNEIVFRSSDPTPSDKVSFEKVIRQTIEKIMSSQYGVVAIGVGSPGLVDYQKGKVVHCPNINFEISELNASVPVYLANDADLALFGEKALRNLGHENVALLTIGTGLGGAFSISSLMPDDYNLAGEIGHMKIVAHGERCGCGGSGCLEAYVSARAIVKKAKESIGPDIGSAEEVFAKARGGNNAALEIIDDMADYLGIGIANLVNILGVEKIFLSGQIAKSADLFAERAEKSARENIFKLDVRNFSVEKSINIDEVALIGAAAFARKKADEK